MTLTYLKELTRLAKRARAIQRTLGTRVAAGFLRNSEVGVNFAVFILARKGAAA